MTADLLKTAHEHKKSFHLKEAIEAFTAFAKQNPDNIEAPANIGLCNLLLGEFTQAAENLSRALDLSKGQDKLVEVYKTAALLAAGKSVPLPDVGDTGIVLSEHLMTVAEQAATAKRPQEALILLESVLKADEPEWLADPTNYFRLVALLTAIGELTTAAEMAKKLLATGGQFSWQGDAAMGLVQVVQGEVAEGKKHLNQALAKGGQSEPVLLNVIAKLSIETL